MNKMFCSENTDDCFAMRIRCGYSENTDETVWYNDETVRILRDSEADKTVRRVAKCFAVRIEY